MTSKALGNVFKLHDEINVKDPAYGAKGDGVTNDTVAIQAAFNAGSQHSRIVIPPGTYLVNGLIWTGKSRATLDCYGTMKNAGGASPILTIDGSVSEPNFNEIRIKAIDGVDKTVDGVLCRQGRFNKVTIEYGTNCDKLINITPNAENFGDNRFEGKLWTLNNDAVYMKGGGTALHHAEGIQVHCQFIATNGYGVRRDNTGTGSLKFLYVHASFDFNTAADVQDDIVPSDSYYLTTFTTPAKAPTGNGLKTSIWVDQKNALMYFGDSIMSYNSSGFLQLKDLTNGHEVLVSGNNGSMEITRAGADAFIDFKSAVSEDFDVRVQVSSNGLRVLTGGNGATVQAARIDDVNALASTEVALELTWNDAATIRQLKQVTVGAADSGGAGFRLLRIPNA